VRGRVGGPGSQEGDVCEPHGGLSDW
jgi:hypothetical protein